VKQDIDQGQPEKKVPSCLDITNNHQQQPRLLKWVYRTMERVGCRKKRRNAKVPYTMEFNKNKDVNAIQQKRRNATDRR
jgi:hypothetical protein